MLYDVIIIGSGLTGLSAALALGRNGFKVALITRDKLIAQEPDNAPSKQLAISTASAAFFDKCGIAHDIQRLGQSINHIRVADDDSHAKIDFNPADIGLNNFGYFIPEATVRTLLLAALSIPNNVDSQSDCSSTLENSAIRAVKPTIFWQSELIDVDLDNEVSTVSIITQTSTSTDTTPQRIQGHLLLAADGRNSRLRERFSFPVKNKDYNQTGIICDIHHPSWPHDGIAVEKFMPSGPFAILPKRDNYYSSLVWTTTHEEGRALTTIPKHLVEQLIMTRLDGYLGKISLVSSIAAYQLALSYVPNPVYRNLVLIGDAAHTIHPIAGQGFNLGLQDLALLVPLLVEQRSLGLLMNCPLLLNKYIKLRRNSIYTMITGTSILNSIFATDIVPVKFLRHAGMNIVDRWQCIKNAVMRYATGMTSRNK